MQFKGKNTNILIEIVETGEQFETRTECAEKLGIHDCKSGRQKVHRGYHFIFPEDYNE